MSLRRFEEMETETGRETEQTGHWQHSPACYLGIDGLVPEIRCHDNRLR
jgi:hypothetical protein